MNPILFLSGYTELSADAEHAAGLLDAFLRLDLPFSAVDTDPEGGIRLLCATRSLPRLRGQAVFSEGRRGGLPLLAGRILRRPGLILGGVLALALLIVSRLYVWDIRVTGNREMSAAEVTTVLGESGGTEEGV